MDNKHQIRRERRDLLLQVWFTPDRVLILKTEICCGIREAIREDASAA